jgi:ribosome-associated protein
VRFLPPDEELEERFVRAGGPGGQHVDRSDTAVQLRFDVPASDWLPEAVKQRLLQLAGSRADGDGVVTIQARTHRSQRRNRDEARRRLADLVERAFRRPRRRRKTAPTRAAKKKRLREKRRRAEAKRRRAKPSLDE